MTAGGFSKSVYYFDIIPLKMITSFEIKIDNYVVHGNIFYLSIPFNQFPKNDSLTFNYFR